MKRCEFHKIIFIIIAFLPTLAYSATFEVEYSVIPISDIKIFYLALTNDNEEKEMSIFQGLHLVLARDKEFDQNYLIGGVDLFAKIIGENFWQRWGLGLSGIYPQTSQMGTPWDIHASLQSGWRFIACSFHHWSNGRGGAEKANLEKYWPDKNDGANAVTCGVVIRF